jgi:hypothetical protein
MVRKKETPEFQSKKILVKIKQNKQSKSKKQKKRKEMGERERERDLQKTERTQARNK